MRYRRLLPLITFMFVLSCAGPQQTTSRMPEGASDAEAPIGTTSITVEASVSTTELYRAAARVLQEQGYALQNTDSDLQALTTNFRGVDPGGIGTGPSYEIQVSAGVTDEGPARIRLTGQMRVPSINATVSTIEKTGQNGSPLRNAWADLFSAAHAIAERTDGSLLFE
jgi:hypothetical protein